jgi:hypothetical protein
LKKECKAASFVKMMGAGSSCNLHLQLYRSFVKECKADSFGFLILFTSHHWRTCMLPIKNLHSPPDMRLILHQHHEGKKNHVKENNLYSNITECYIKKNTRERKQSCVNQKKKKKKEREFVWQPSW